MPLSDSAYDSYDYEDPESDVSDDYDAYDRPVSRPAARPRAPQATAQPKAQAKGQPAAPRTPEKPGAAAVLSASGSEMKFSASQRHLADLIAESARQEDVKSSAALLAKASTTVNVLVVGHVDAGKSTIFGHLAALVGSVDPHELARCQKIAQTQGKASFAFAYVLDSNNEERERGLTIDVCNHNIDITLPAPGGAGAGAETHRVILQDCPGHRDFVPLLITSISLPDAAVLVLDSSPNEFEKGVSRQGQTLENLFLLAVFGVRTIVVAVNKMDRSQWTLERYQFVRDEISRVLRQDIQFGGAIVFVPLAGVAPDAESNLMPGCAEGLPAWVRAEASLGQALFDLRPSGSAALLSKNNSEPVAVVYGAYKEAGGDSKRVLCFECIMEAGILSAADALIHLPSRQCFTVARIDVQTRVREAGSPGSPGGPGEAQSDSDAGASGGAGNGADGGSRGDPARRAIAKAPDFVTLKLLPERRPIRGGVSCAGDDDTAILAAIRTGSCFVLTGTFLKCEAVARGTRLSGVAVSNRVKAHLLVIDADSGVSIGEEFDCFVGVSRVDGTLHRIDGVLDPRAGRIVVRAPPMAGHRQHIRADIVFSRDIPLAEFASSKLLGRLILRRDGATVALGFVERISDK